MNPLAKKIIASLVAGVALLSVYYGSYLPYKKSHAFITTMRGLNQSASLDKFKEALSVPLDIPSPIGQEELVRQIGNVIMNVVNQPNTNAAVIDELLRYLGQYYDPIIERGSGMSFGQNFYILGTMNEAAFLKTQEVKYLEAAKRYYLAALESGPKRPQPLFGLFDIYRILGDVEKTKAIAEQILNQWPTEERTRQALAEFLEKVSIQHPK